MGFPIVVGSANSQMLFGPTKSANQPSTRAGVVMLSPFHRVLWAAVVFPFLVAEAASDDVKGAEMAFSSMGNSVTRRAAVASPSASCADRSGALF